MFNKVVLSLGTDVSLHWFSCDKNRKENIDYHLYYFVQQRFKMLFVLLHLDALNLVWSFSVILFYFGGIVLCNMQDEYLKEFLHLENKILIYETLLCALNVSSWWNIQIVDSKEQQTQYWRTSYASPAIFHDSNCDHILIIRNK